MSNYSNSENISGFWTFAGRKEGMNEYSLGDFGGGEAILCASVVVNI